jgi:hypothetical protein
VWAEALQGNIRIQIWRDTLRIIPDRWLTGWGGGLSVGLSDVRTLREQMPLSTMRIMSICTSGGLWRTSVSR